MTKLRPPVSIENTLYRVLGELGVERAAEVTGRSEHYLRSLSDPDKREQLTVRDMIFLDVACRAAGDVTFPLWETVGLILEAAGAGRLTATAALGHHAAEVAREQGEATAAMIEAAIAGDDPQKLKHALREMEQAREATTDAISSIQAHIARAEPP